LQAKRSPSGRPKKPQIVESDGDLSDSDDELVNVPPAKARKVNKARDVKLEDIFSDGEIVFAPRKSKSKPAPDHDADADPEESLSDESKSNQKPKKGHAPDATPFKWTEADIPLVCPEEDCNNAVTLQLDWFHSFVIALAQFMSEEPMQMVFGVLTSRSVPQCKSLVTSMIDINALSSVASSMWTFNYLPIACGISKMSLTH